MWKARLYLTTSTNVDSKVLELQSIFHLNINCKKIINFQMKEKTGSYGTQDTLWPDNLTLPFCTSFPCLGMVQADHSWILKL